MIDRSTSLKTTILVVVLAAGAVALGAWGAVVLVATTAPAISLTTLAIALGCGLTLWFIHRSHLAHDRAIASTYPSFGPALARRRAEADRSA